MHLSLDINSAASRVADTGNRAITVERRLQMVGLRRKCGIVLAYALSLFVVGALRAQSLADTKIAFASNRDGNGNFEIYVSADTHSGC